MMWEHLSGLWLPGLLPALPPPVPLPAAALGVLGPTEEGAGAECIHGAGAGCIHGPGAYMGLVHTWAWCRVHTWACCIHGAGAGAYMGLVQGVWYGVYLLM